MVMAVEQAQVKHAYAATGCYSPQFIHTRKVLVESNIGQIREIEYVIHLDFVRGLAYYWFHQLAEGGSILYQGLPHMRAQIKRITGGEYRAAAGEARRLIEQAAIGPEVHDWRRHTAADRHRLARADPM